MLISFSFDIYLEVGLLNHIVAVLVYIPTNSVQSFPFSTSSPVLTIFHPFDNSHSKSCEKIPHCAFHLSWFGCDFPPKSSCVGSVVPRVMVLRWWDLYLNCGAQCEVLRSWAVEPLEGIDVFLMGPLS